VGLAALLVMGLLIGGSLWGRNYYHHGPGMMWGSGFPYGMHTFGGGIGMILVWVVVLGLIAGGGALLVGGLTRQAGAPAKQEKTPLEILKRRYARGEIDRENYNHMRETLSG
jgi:putative membrane protein